MGPRGSAAPTADFILLQTVAVVEQSTRGPLVGSSELGGQTGMVNIGRLLPIPIEDIDEAIRRTAQGPPLPPLVRGVVARFVQRFAVLTRRAIPDLGVTPKGDTPLPGSKRKPSAIIDQSFDAGFDAIGEADVRAMFAT